MVVADSLVPGQTYIFRLIGRDMNGKGFAEIPVLVNQAPTSGSFAVDPVMGSAIQTDFVLFSNSPSFGEPHGLQSHSLWRTPAAAVS